MMATKALNAGQEAPGRCKIDTIKREFRLTLTKSYAGQFTGQ